jgi:3-oxoadipate enol-lactonase
MSDAMHPAWPAVERGRGRPVVFLHGYPLNHRMWEPQLRDLSANYHVILLDLPGYGLSEATPAPDSLRGYAETVHSTLKRRIPGPFTLVGHSFGGYLALQLLQAHPEQVDSLVLTDTRSGADSPEANEKRLATARRLETPGESLDVEATAQMLLAPATWDAQGPIPEGVRAMVRSAPSPTVIATLRSMAGRADLTAVLSHLRIPTLVVWGEEDRLVPPSESQSMVGRVAGGVGVGIPGAGHLPSLEAPDRFNLALSEFLGRLPPYRIA